ncbi:HAD family hydrolase [Streptacidiphilus cavernicola]|uniref:HAD family hydrolase n=1 Tax=Streptacidiphilus cavernicola TaxID=3342716 RepID=A0ABV6VSF8_9ACTN
MTGGLLVAVDTDGVLLNDSYSPVIREFTARHGVPYTAEVELAVWGRPQREAGRALARICGLDASPEEVVARFFADRAAYLEREPVQVLPGVPEFLERLRSAGARLVCYGGRTRSYFDEHLGHLAGYFDRECPYVDVNAIRPGVREILDRFGAAPGRALFIDDVSHVAWACREERVGFIGVPPGGAPGAQRSEMRRAGVRHTVAGVAEIDDALLAADSFWESDTVNSAGRPSG